VVIEYRTILGHQAELALTKLRDNVDFDTLQSALAVLAIARGELKLGAMIHLKDQKIFCSRSASVLEIPLVRSTDKVSPRQRAADFYEKRIASAKARPATVTSLQSAILSHFHKVLSAEDVAEVLEALTAAGHVVVNGKKVAYPDRVNL